MNFEQRLIFTQLQAQKDQGYIAVDLDGTLAMYEDGTFDPEKIGAPIAPMIARIKKWLKHGKRVKIFTARVHDDPGGKIKRRIEDWCEEHLGQRLEVTNVKDHNMIELWDDRAVQVERNTGKPVT